MIDKYLISCAWFESYNQIEVYLDEKQAETVKMFFNELFGKLPKNKYPPTFHIANMSKWYRQKKAEEERIAKEKKEAHAKFIRENGDIARAFRAAMAKKNKGE